jgi:hypothetical protein
LLRVYGRDQHARNRPHTARRQTTNIVQGSLRHKLEHEEILTSLPHWQAGGAASTRSSQFPPLLSKASQLLSRSNQWNKTQGLPTCTRTSTAPLGHTMAVPALSTHAPKQHANSWRTANRLGNTQTQHTAGLWSCQGPCVGLIHILSNTVTSKARTITSKSTFPATLAYCWELNRCLSSCSGNPGNDDAYQAAAVHEHVLDLRNKRPGRAGCRTLSLTRDACFLRLRACQA